MPDADVRVGGRYRLGRKLAAGGMGAVWEGWDERLHRTIAIKRLHLQPWMSDEERNVGVQRAMREARITARLHHPNVVQVFDIVDDQDRPCLIMEYVPSRSLQEIIRDGGPLPPADAVRIGALVAAGLAAAHAAGVVHRDVKPGNVLIGADGAVKVTDFGISRAFGDSTVTSTGLVIGTPAYLAPEVARGAAPTFATDVYALGATLYMMVEGKPPFGSDENPMAVLHRVASGEWDPPQRSGALSPLITRMMALDPNARPSMSEVASALQQLHSAVPGTADTTQIMRGATAPVPPVSPAAPLPLAPATTTQVRKRRNRSLLLPLLTLVLVLVLGAVVSYVLLSGSGDNGGPTTAATNTPGRTTQPAQRTRSSAKNSVTENSATQTSAVTTAPAANPPAGRGSPTASELAAAVTEYFQLVPDDLDAGWNRLTPHFQHTRAVDRQTYDSYWNSVDHVDVSNVQGIPPDGASADLVYYYTDGRVVPQHTTFRLVRRGGILKIDAES